jgi:hypothetical protein
MKIEMLLVLFQRGALKRGCLAALNPQPAGFHDGDACPIGGVDPGPHIYGNAGMIRVGVLLARECFDVAGAALVGIVDDPGLPCLATWGLPTALANRHGASCG